MGRWPRPVCPGPARSSTPPGTRRSRAGPDQQFARAATDVASAVPATCWPSSGSSGRGRVRAALEKSDGIAFRSRCEKPLQGGLQRHGGSGWGRCAVSILRADDKPVGQHGAPVTPPHSARRPAASGLREGSPPGSVPGVAWSAGRCTSTCRAPGVVAGCRHASGTRSLVARRERHPLPGDHGRDRDPNRRRLTSRLPAVAAAASGPVLAAMIRSASARSRLDGARSGSISHCTITPLSSAW